MERASEPKTKLKKGSERRESDAQGRGRGSIEENREHSDYVQRFVQSQRRFKRNRLNRCDHDGLRRLQNQLMRTGDGRFLVVMARRIAGDHGTSGHALQRAEKKSRDQN